jgi:hypothetical protein
MFGKCLIVQKLAYYLFVDTASCRVLSALTWMCLGTASSKELGGACNEVNVKCQNQINCSVERILKSKLSKEFLNAVMNEYECVGLFRNVTLWQGMGLEHLPPQWISSPVGKEFFSYVTVNIY